MCECLPNLVLRLGRNVMMQKLLRGGSPSTRGLGSVEHDFGVVVRLWTAAANILDAACF